MGYEIKKIRPRHSEIIRLAFLGLGNAVIAERVGITPMAVACILRSAVARAEIARLTHEAELRLLDTPLRARAALELDKAAMESLRLNRSIVNDTTLDKKLRSKVASHFLDRLVFNKDPDVEEGSYREILRSLRTIEDQFSRKPVVIDAVATPAPRAESEESFDTTTDDLSIIDTQNDSEGDDFEVIKKSA